MVWNVSCDKPITDRMLVKDRLLQINDKMVNVKCKLFKSCLFKKLVCIDTMGKMHHLVWFGGFWNLNTLFNIHTRNYSFILVSVYR